MSDDIVRAVALVITQEALRCDRGWDYQGIWASVRRALDEDGRTPRQIVEAGFAAVDDPKAETPAALRWSARYKAATTATGQQSEPRCVICDRTRPGHDLAESKLLPTQRHEFEVTR